MQNDWANLAAILGSLGTLVVAFFTWLNIKIARDTLKLMAQREKRLSPDLELFRIDSFLKHDKEHKLHLYAVNLRVSNRSETDNAIKDLTLRVYFKRQQEITSNVNVSNGRQVMASTLSLMNLRKEDLIVAPVRIKARDIIAGWALFEVSDEIIDDTRMERYEVVVTDTNNIINSFEVLVMQER